MPSKELLQQLPNIEALKRLTQSLAVLDTILSPRWEYRYYSFNAKWSEGETMASMTNGSGDEYFILFNKAGVAIKGFDHESAMSPWCNEEHRVWPGVLTRVPSEFGSFLSEPAFSMKDTTFCIWRRIDDQEWQTGEIDYPEGKDPDGSIWLLSILIGGAKIYKTYASEYFEKEISLAAIEHVYQHRKIDLELLQSLNPEASFDEINNALMEIGYPR